MLSIMTNHSDTKARIQSKQLFLETSMVKVLEDFKNSSIGEKSNDTIERRIKHKESKSTREAMEEIWNTTHQVRTIRSS